MYKLLTSKGQMFALILGAVVTIITLISSFGDEHGFGLAASIGLIILCVLCIIVFGLLNVIENPGGAKRGIVLFGSLAILFLLLYFTSGASESGSLAETMKTFDISDVVSKIISGEVRTSIILAVGAFVSLVVFEIINIFK